MGPDNLHVWQFPADTDAADWEHALVYKEVVSSAVLQWSLMMLISFKPKTLSPRLIVFRFYFIKEVWLDTL